MANLIQELVRIEKNFRAGGVEAKCAKCGDILAGGPGSGCRGPNCGRKKGSGKGVQTIVDRDGVKTKWQDAKRARKDWEEKNKVFRKIQKVKNKFPSDKETGKQDAKSLNKIIKGLEQQLKIGTKARDTSAPFTRRELHQVKQVQKALMERNISRAVMFIDRMPSHLRHEVRVALKLESPTKWDT